MFTVGKLIQLALGYEEARHVDTALPQHFVNSQTEYERQNNAGWYYDKNASGGRSLMGRRLSKAECWSEIRHKVRQGQLVATMVGEDLSSVVADWPCFHEHVERGEIQLEEAL